MFDWFLDEMVRVVEKRGKDCRLHYWFYPDSFDIWVSNIDAEESEKRDETFQGIWHVAANWLLDTAEFNEWMNEEDYEIDEDLVGNDMNCVVTAIRLF
jgi:SWI/SNF related-matrix-associated actin-dependent regulator of chromatin subfamily C